MSAGYAHFGKKVHFYILILQIGSGTWSTQLGSKRLNTTLGQIIDKSGAIVDPKTKWGGPAKSELWKLRVDPTHPKFCSRYGRSSAGSALILATICIETAQPDFWEKYNLIGLDTNSGNEYGWQDLLTEFGLEQATHTFSPNFEKRIALRRLHPNLKKKLRVEPARTWNNKIYMKK